MPISRYMQFCLSHPTEGYYSKGDVFGQKGDFITSPEISQVFGEVRQLQLFFLAVQKLTVELKLVAVWLLTRFLAAGSPERVRLVELGPGRGTLMDDVLRVRTVMIISRAASDATTDILTVPLHSKYHQVHPPCRKQREDASTSARPVI